MKQAIGAEVAVRRYRLGPLPASLGSSAILALG
jgi:hypothetical protein